MNILVTGAKGQLGLSIQKGTVASQDNYLFTDIDTLDITDRASVKKFVEDNQVEIIINCAAFTNVDKAEDEVDLCRKINSDAVAILAEEIKKHDGLLFHISTDYVFGGDQNNIPITEEKKTNPTGVYGKTKLEGEKAIKNSGCRYIILRTSWLYSEFGNNFLKTMLRLLSDKNEIKVVFDQCGTPTYAGDLAKAIIDIIENRKFEGNEGIYHFSNEGVCSWYDFSRHISEYGNLTDCRIDPCHSSEFPSKVIRPSYSVLDKTKFKKTFSLDIPYWTESLKECLKNMGNK